MYLGVVPDVLPLAPRPVEGELRSSWLLRVASANALTLGELMDAAAGRHPLAGVDRAFLDDGLPPPVVAALAQFARLHETAVRGLDLARQLPGLPDVWVLRGPSLYAGSRDRASDRRAHYAFCPRCLVSASLTSTPPYIPVEWACAVDTHCPTHDTRLLDCCPACFALDPFVMGVGEPPGLAECWQCDAGMGLPGWPPDSLAVIAPALHLQTALISALRDQTCSHWAIGPVTTRVFVRLVAELLDLLVDVDDGKPVFARVATIHWPNELRVVGRPIPESRFAYLPVRWRFLAMVSAAAVFGDPKRGWRPRVGQAPSDTRRFAGGSRMAAVGGTHGSLAATNPSKACRGSTPAFTELIARTQSTVQPVHTFRVLPRSWCRPWVR